MPNEGSYEAALRRSNEVHEELKVNPGKYTMLTGDRPTGRLHLGHYFGTLVDRVRLQEMGVRTNIIIADYQVITDRDTTKNIQDNVFNMVVDYLACGIDPEKTMIFTHSAVPEANQLMLPFLSLVTEAEMERNPTVKAEQEASGHELTGQLLVEIIGAGILHLFDFLYAGNRFQNALQRGVDGLVLAGRTPETNGNGGALLRAGGHAQTQRHQKSQKQGNDFLGCHEMSLL